MYTTRIDRKLSAMELHKALIYANGAFQEYIGLLHALVLSNCVDGAESEQPLFQVPMIFRATKTKLVKSQENLLKASKRRIIHLDNLGIEPDEYFRASGFYLLKPSDGLTMLPLKLVGLGFTVRFERVQCYAIKIATPPDFYGSPSYDDEPFRHRPVDDVCRIKAPDEIPEGFVVAPEIIVPSNKYFYWLHTLEEILCYRLTPLQLLFPVPISPPVFTHCNVIFPNGDGIYLPRLNVHKEKFTEDELLRFSDIAKPLLTYESHTMMTLALVAQEVNRRLSKEKFKDEYSKTDIAISFDDKTTPSTPDGKNAVDLSSAISFPDLVRYFAKQGWNKDDSWYKRRLDVANIKPLPKKGAKGAILYPNAAAKVVIADAITAENGKKSQY